MRLSQLPKYVGMYGTDQRVKGESFDGKIHVRKIRPIWLEFVVGGFRTFSDYFQVSLCNKQEFYCWQYWCHRQTRQIVSLLELYITCT